MKTIAEIPVSIYKIFSLPIIEGTTIPEKQEKKPVEPVIDIVEKTDKKGVSKEEKHIKDAMELVDAWMANPVNALNVGQSGGTAGFLYQAKNDLNDFVTKSIDWLNEGVSVDAFSRIDAAYSNRSLIGFERQYPKKNHLIQLSSNLETRKIIEGFVRYRVIGKKSWNFSDSNDYLLAITTWLERVKPTIINATKGYGAIRSNYVNYGIAADVFRVILNGYCGKYSDIKSLKPEILLNLKFNTAGSENAHCREWNDLLKVVNNEDGKDHHELVLQFYNLPQGSKKSSNYIIDYQTFVRDFQSVIGTGLKFKDEDLQLKDPIRQRSSVSEHLKKITNNIGKTVEAEKKLPILSNT